MDQLIKYQLAQISWKNKEGTVFLDILQYTADDLVPQFQVFTKTL